LILFHPKRTLHSASSFIVHHTLAMRIVLKGRFLLVSVIWILSFQGSLAFLSDWAHRADQFPAGMSTNNIRHRSGGQGIKKTVAAVSPGRTSDDHESKQSKAIAAIQSCCTVAAVSAVVDSVTLWMSSDDQSLFALGSVVWKLGWAFSLYRVSTIHDERPVKAEDIHQVIISVCETISPLFRLAAWIIAFGSMGDIVGLFYERIPWIREGFLAALLVSAVAIRVVSARETKALTVAGANVDKGAAAAQRAGHRAVRNMALCSGALLIRGAVLVPIALSQASWVGQLFQLAGVPTPVATAVLLLTLRRSVLRTIVAATSSSQTKFDPKQRDELNDAQAAFYSKVAGTFRSDIAIKVLLGVGGLLASLLKNS
jgi:hypothetical protein